MRLTIDEYAVQFKMSKEIIHSKLRSKQLDYTVEGGTTYIILKSQPSSVQIASEKINKSNVDHSTLRHKSTVGTIIALYQKENQQLKLRIKELESKVDRLIDDKENMLRDERDRIEKIYTHRDEQLKSFLELINTKLLIASDQAVLDVDVDARDEPLIEASWQQSNFIELRKYLKKLEVDPSQKKSIKKRFANGYGHDVRIIQQNGEFFLDFSKYDYSDLLKH